MEELPVARFACRESVANEVEAAEEEAEGEEEHEDEEEDEEEAEEEEEEELSKVCYKCNKRIKMEQLPIADELPGAEPVLVVPSEAELGAGPGQLAAESAAEPKPSRSHRRRAARRSASMNAAEPNPNGEANLSAGSGSGQHMNRRKNKWHIQRNLAPKLKRQRSFSANYAPVSLGVWAIISLAP